MLFAGIGMRAVDEEDADAGGGILEQAATVMVVRGRDARQLSLYTWVCPVR